MLTLHTCKIARRGKAAKGTVEVQTFGLPITGDDGVTRDWSYAEYADEAKYPLEELVVYLQQFGLNNLVLIQAIDNLNKSETMKSQNAAVLLAALLTAESLLKDDEKADDIAKALISARKSNVTLYGEDNPMTIDWMLDKRRNMIDKERKKKGMAPRLVKKPEVTAEDVDSE